MVCKEKEVVGKDFVVKIESLVEKGVLIKEGVGIFYQFWVFGNKVVYEVELYLFIQLLLVIDVVDYLFFGVYVLLYYVKRIFR